MRPTLACPRVGKGSKYLMIQIFEDRQIFCEGKKGHQLFSKWSLDLSPQYILMKMVYMGAYKPPVYRHVKCMPIPCGLGQKPCSCLHAALIGESIYEKKALNPKKLIQKVFQWILVVLGVLNNILKIYQNLPHRKPPFSKWRPRWLRGA